MSFICPDKFSYLKDFFQEIPDFPPHNLLIPTKEDPLPRYFKEWRDRFEGSVCPVVRPQTTEQLSKIVQYCTQKGIALIPQGGNTGLVGGQVPLHLPPSHQPSAHSYKPSLLLSLEHFNKIRHIDPLNNTIVVEAGVALEKVQEAAHHINRLFPLDLASRGSAQIGGLISTNAGGIAVMRYGTMRSFVLGLEVILKEGQIWNGLRTIRKDTMGYDLKQLFIGAEGTLGIITAASLRLFPAVKTATAAIAVETPDHALTLLRFLEEQLGACLTGFELVPEIGLDMVLKHMPQTSLPFQTQPPWMIILEASFPPLLGDEQGQELLTQCLSTAFEEEMITDAVIAQNLSQADQLWHLRESLSEAQKGEGASLKHDISVPVASLPDFIAHINQGAIALIEGIRPVPFGHFADGNLHYNFSQPLSMTKEDFLAQRERLENFVHSETMKWGGSIAAEHGIGQAKVNDQHRYTCPTEYALMQEVKRSLDPCGVFNPHKVIQVID
jgi:FAD/FMN-containing dehydrogenase